MLATVMPGTALPGIDGEPCRLCMFDLNQVGAERDFPA